MEKLNILWRDKIREVTRQPGDTDAPKEFLKAYLIGRHASMADGSDDTRQINDAPHLGANMSPTSASLRRERTTTRFPPTAEGHIDGEIEAELRPDDEVQLFLSAGQP